MAFNQQLLCVTGLPRAGSTLLCQLLGVHPAIYSTGHSSPLLAALGQLRHHLSDNTFLLAQLDVDFPQAYGRLLSAFRGFMQGWFAESQQLPVKPHESDSHYRYKYRHATQSRLQPVQQHTLPARIQQELYTHFDWFYATFYPGLTASRSL